MDPLYESGSIIDPVLQVVNKFKLHPSVTKIKSNKIGLNTFKFKEVTNEEVHELVNSLDCAKKAGGDIPTRILKLSLDVISPFLTYCINICFNSCKFPNSLKLAEITPVPKKDDSHSASDYRPISILPLLSKIFEKVMADQLSKFFETKFSKLLCGFRKRHSCQPCFNQTF